MSVLNKWALHVVVIGSTQINATKDIQINPGVNKLFEYGAGQPDPQFAGYDGEQPLLTFSTTAIKKLLTGLNPTTPGATDFRALGGGVNADFYFQQMAPGGTRLTDTTGKRIRVSAGIACLNRISGREAEVATGEGKIYAISTDGETSPLTITEDVALPSLGATNELYTIGPGRINDVDIGAVESLDYDPMIEVRMNRGDGQAYPTFAYLLRRGNEQSGASLRLTTRHLGTLASSVTTISDITRGTLRSLKQGGHREAESALKHIIISASAGGVLMENIGGRDGDEARLAIDINGTGSPPFGIVVDQALD